NLLRLLLEPGDEGAPLLDLAVQFVGDAERRRRQGRKNHEGHQESFHGFTSPCFGLIGGPGGTFSVRGGRPPAKRGSRPPRNEMRARKCPRPAAGKFRPAPVMSGTTTDYHFPPHSPALVISLDPPPAPGKLLSVHLLRQGYG